MEHRQNAKLDREIEEMEKAILGTTDDTKSTLEGQDEEAKTEQKVDPAASFEEEAPSKPEENVEAEQEVAPKETSKKTVRNDWKGRYTSLRAHHDSKMFELRNEVSFLKNQIVELNKTMDLMSKEQKPKAKPVDYSDVLSQEEKDILGPEAVAALAKMTQKATESAMNPLQEKLDAEKQKWMAREAKEAKDNKASANAIFLQRLGQLVPDFATIDVDPKFEEYLNEADAYSGFPRKVLFQKAERAGDVGRVAEFFIGFQKASKPAKPVDALEEHVTPSGEGSAESTVAANNDGKVMTMAFVNQFYQDYAKGRYKGKQKLVDQIESDIEKAYMEGRLK